MHIPLEQTPVKVICPISMVTRSAVVNLRSLPNAPALKSFHQLAISPAIGVWMEPALKLCTRQHLYNRPSRSRV